MSYKTEVINELASKMSEMVSKMIYSNAAGVYDDLRKMVKEEGKACQIALKPELKVFMDCEQIIDVNATLSWKYELKRSDRTESVQIDPRQLELDFEEEIEIAQELLQDSSNELFKDIKGMIEEIGENE